MQRNNGFKNEKQIVTALDGKKAKQLPNNLKHMIEEMFGFFVAKEKVKAGLIEHFQKADIYIDYNGIRTNVSIKYGRSEGVGEESIKTFIQYLRKWGLSIRGQQTVLLYQFGDGTMDGTGKERLDYARLRVLLQERIKDLNKEINDNKELVKDFVDRCLFKGTEYNKVEADCIYHGDVEYGVTCTRKQIMKHVERRTWDFMENLHIGPIQFRPHARYVGKKIVLEERRWIVSFWWANLAADLDYIAERYN